MKTIINTSSDPYFNLALEEYLLKNPKFNEDIFYLWQNEKAVVIGRNQNPFLEVNMKKVKEEEIPLIRRITGGGTVYHDMGNINFTFIKNGLKGYLNNYRVFLEPIVSILNKFGVKAKFVEKSHIYIGDKKISGNAQSFYKDRVIHHGTLLFDTDLESLQAILTNMNNIKTHSIKSNIVKTTNIKSHMVVEATIKDIKEFILNNIFNQEYKKHLINLTKTDILEINKLSQEKYHNWDWNFGETSEFVIEKKISENSFVSLKIQKGIITEVKTNSTSELEKFLVGIRYSFVEIKHALATSNIKEIDKLIEKLLY